MGQPSFIQLGFIQDAFGIKGWFKVFSYCRPKKQILDYPSWHLRLDNTETIYRLEQGKPHGKCIIAKLSGIESRDQAEALNKAEVWVPTSSLETLPDGEFYWYQLIGLEVKNLQGQSLGRIEQIMETGANDVIVVSTQKGSQQILIPYVRNDIVKEVNLNQKSMIVDWLANY